MTRSVRQPKEPDGNQIIRMQEFPNVARPSLAGSGGEQPDSNGAEVASIGTGRKEHKAEIEYVATNTGGRLCRTAGVYRSKQWWTIVGVQPPSDSDLSAWESQHSHAVRQQSDADSDSDSVCSMHP
ncbi:hypothetical protein [Porphyromonas gulae]|uniref:hypothetical protein n=1 Tax=Porphyromonas gulae TaxID=111105 RepID=UPI00051D03BE|nr:hypothetical protein [Porphyromonas gulae]KGL50432.1 hypothetical protein HQ49_00960 [Porphyromonas gulae]